MKSVRKIMAWVTFEEGECPDAEAAIQTLVEAAADDCAEVSIEWFGESPEED